EQLHQRLDQPRMARHDLEHFIELMRGKGRARRAGLFAPDFLAIELEDVFRLRAQKRDLFFRETVWEEDIALFVESLELLGGKFHGVLPEKSGPSAGPFGSSLPAERPDA